MCWCRASDKIRLEQTVLRAKLVDEQGYMVRERRPNRPTVAFDGRPWLYPLGRFLPVRGQTTSGP